MCVLLYQTTRLFRTLLGGKFSFYSFPDRFQPRSAGTEPLLFHRYCDWHGGTPSTCHVYFASCVLHTYRASLICRHTQTHTTANSVAIVAVHVRGCLKFSLRKCFYIFIAVCVLFWEGVLWFCFSLFFSFFCSSFRHPSNKMGNICSIRLMYISTSRVGRSFSFEGGWKVFPVYVCACSLANGSCTCLM